MSQPPPSRVLVAGALFALYVVWGSTYLAMEYALDGFPPLLMAAVRHTTAGVILFAVLRARGVPWPTRTQWRGAFVTGTLLLAGGNGGVALAERWVPSSFAAMVLASMPLWVAVIGVRYGTRPTRRELLGLVVGFSGVIVLDAGAGISGDPVAFAALALAPILWAWGSVLSARIDLPRGPMSTATQMLTGGAVLIALGIVHGERIAVPPEVRPMLAIAYLVVFGSLIAFSAYGFLLRSVRPAVATSYAYVNPIVAIVLGMSFRHEQLTGRAIIATVLTLGGVFIIARRARPKA